MNKVVAGNPINFLDQARDIFDVDGRGESTHKPPAPSCQLPLAVMRLLPPLIVVSAMLGGCDTTGSLPSTGSSEPGADEAADPASTLLLVADPANPLLESPGFRSKPLIVLLDHAERGVGRCGGRFMGRCRGVSVLTSTRRFYRKGTRRSRKNKEKRTYTKINAGTFWAVSSVRGTFSAVSSIGGTFGRYPVSAVPFGWYPVLVVPFGRCRELMIPFWRYWKSAVLSGGI